MENQDLKNCDMCMNKTKKEFANENKLRIKCDDKEVDYIICPQCRILVQNKQKELEKWPDDSYSIFDYIINKINKTHKKFMQSIKIKPFHLNVPTV